VRENKRELNGEKKKKKKQKKRSGKKKKKKRKKNKNKKKKKKKGDQMYVKAKEAPRAGGEGRSSQKDTKETQTFS